MRYQTSMIKYTRLNGSLVDFTYNISYEHHIFIMLIVNNNNPLQILTESDARN